MDDTALRADIERIVRARLQPGFEAQKNRIPLSGEKRRRLLENMSPVFREMIERDGWPQPSAISEEMHEEMISTETDEMLNLVLERRKASGNSGPLDEDELHDAYVSRSDVGLGFLLTRLKASPAHPIRDSLIRMMEQNNADVERLRNDPAEEEIAEINERITAQFREFDVEGTLEKYKELANENEDDS